MEFQRAHNIPLRKANHAQSDDIMHFTMKLVL
jgi:hypothetical protein